SHASYCSLGNRTVTLWPAAIFRWRPLRSLKLFWSRMHTLIGMLSSLIDQSSEGIYPVYCILLSIVPLTIVSLSPILSSGGGRKGHGTHYGIYSIHRKVRPARNAAVLSEPPAFGSFWTSCCDTEPPSHAHFGSGWGASHPDRRMAPHECSSSHHLQHSPIFARPSCRFPGG